MIKTPTAETPGPRSPTDRTAPRRRVTLTMQTDNLSFLAILNFDDLAVFYENRRKTRSAE